MLKLSDKVIHLILIAFFYGFYFAALALFLSFFPMYFDYLGFNGRQIGVLFALAGLTKLFASNLWAYIATRYLDELQVIQIACLGSLIAGVGVIFVHQYVLMLITVTIFGFFCTGILSQLEMVTLKGLKLANGNTDAYGRLRLYGSIGFVVSVLCGGVLFEMYGIQFLPVMYVGMFVVLFLISLLLIPGYHLSNNLSLSTIKKSKSLKSLLSDKSISIPVVLFLLAGLLLNVSHGPLNNFFGIYLKGIGYSEVDVGIFWAVSVVAEICLMAFSVRIFERFNVVHVFVFSIAIGVVRWSVMPLVQGATHWHEWLVLFLLQVLHAFNFGAFHLSSVKIIEKLFSDGHAVQGQALYSSVCFGLGGALGSIISGQAWLYGAEALFFVAVLCSFFGSICAIKLKSYLKFS